MSEAPQPSVGNIPLDQMDVSDPDLFGNDTWQPWFARLRSESPVHYCANSPFGAYWSVTTHDLIKQVDANHRVFSSAQGMTILDVDDSSLSEADLAMENFIGMDPPEHDVHRATVAPTLAPTNLANFEPLIRERAAEILGNRLAEMQLRILWEEIVKRFDKVEQVGNVARLPNNFIRGVAEVPIRLIRK